MTKTTNYQLPQWEANDPVRREDFNAAMASIEEGIRSASYVVGSYTGNGITMANGGQTICLGFRPRFCRFQNLRVSGMGRPQNLLRHEFLKNALAK